MESKYVICKACSYSLNHKGDDICLYCRKKLIPITTDLCGGGNIPKTFHGRVAKYARREIGMGNVKVERAYGSNGGAVKLIIKKDGSIKGKNLIDILRGLEGYVRRVNPRDNGEVVIYLSQ